MAELTVLAFALLGCLAVRRCYRRFLKPSTSFWRIIQFSRYALLMILVTGSVVVLIGGFTVTFIIWDGWPEVAVRFDITGEPPVAVGCYPLPRREWAEELLSDIQQSPQPRPLEEVFGHHPAVLADPFNGAPVSVRIWTSGRESAFGCELSRGQEEAILVGAEWRDGRRIWKVVDAPDLRQSREVRVALP